MALDDIRLSFDRRNGAGSPIGGQPAERGFGMSTTNLAADGKPIVDFTAEAQDSFYWHIHENFAPRIAEAAGRQISKFHVLLAIAAVLTAMMLFWLGRRMKSGAPPRGVFQGLLESLVYFVRDQIARPAIDHHDDHGHVHHDGDKFVPFLATTFLFILICNLLGMIPFMGSPTASIAVTAALSLVGFLVTHGAGIAQNGIGGYFKSYIPHFELEGGPGIKLFGFMLTMLILLLEVMTPFIRAFVLAVRLFANMLAGHVAIFVLLFFIQMVSQKEWLDYTQGPSFMYYLVAPMSVVMVTALSILELLVAGLQAFIFTLLTAIFIGLAKHPAH
ncbi:MAG: F0F1 ATP synthase subunit A [Fimbriiglobus sp.]